MKIYVSELPKNCDECPLHRSGRLKLQKGARYIDAKTCVLGNFYKFQEIDDEIDTCPLETTQSLKLQVREEAVEEIREKTKNIKENILTYYGENGVINDMDYGQIYGLNKLLRILDQVKGENDVNIKKQ